MPELVTPLGILIAIGVGAYLLGSVPFGVVVSRLFGLADPRSIGSGNIGATNILRSGSKAAALLTLLLDALKGTVAVLLAGGLGGEDAAQLAALGAFAGHVWPLYLTFKGGKGVATLLGILVALSPIVGLVAALTWLLTAVVSRLSSLAAIVAAVATPMGAALLGQGDKVVLLIVLSVILIWRHRGNIARLREGTEPRIGRK
jgi:acyl phosphate:glycerol-3-phosphate acyltransferase